MIKGKRIGIHTNLELLVKNKERPNAGDVFVFKPRDRDYYFGLVIDPNVQLVDASGKPAGIDWDGALVYVYNQHAGRKQLIPELDLGKLLLPPLILDLYCWRRGYVESVASGALVDRHIHPRHCFWDVIGKRYVDEKGQPVPQRLEPCGIYGLTPFRGFDDQISRALSLPPAAN